MYVRCFPGRRRGKEWLRIEIVFNFSDVGYSNPKEKSRRKKILSSEAHASVVYGWPRNLPEVRTVFQIQIHPVCPIVFSWATWFPLTSSPDWLPWILVVFGWKTALQSVGACLECPEASTFGKDRQSYAFMAGKRAPSSHESPGKWNQEPVTLIIGGGVGKSPVWCIQDWPRLRHYTDRWPTTRWRALLLTALNFIQFHVKYIF